jgi:hypothetical protein
MSWSFHFFRVPGKEAGRFIPVVASFIRTRRWGAAKMAGWWPVRSQPRGTSPEALWELDSFHRVAVVETRTVGWSDCRAGRPLIDCGGEMAEFVTWKDKSLEKQKHAHRI